MMQTAKNRLRHDPQVLRKPVPVHVQWHRQIRRRLWDARPQGHVRAPSIVMWDPLREEVLQVVCRQGKQVIQAFPPQCADEPLAERIGLGALRRGFEGP